MMERRSLTAEFFFDGNLNQLWIQVMEALIGFTWSFVGSYLTFALIDCVPGFEVLANNDDAIAGMDMA
jgi:ammonia channel protein AmtB